MNGMRTTHRVHGFMALKDEWPLCAVSIPYALEHHVDDLLVIDHGSGEATTMGLRTLVGRFEGRLRVLRLDDLPFWQAEITAEMLHRIDADPDDWLYVLDADEFLLTTDGRGLRDVLAEQAPSTTSIRYQADNWISTVDFDEADLASYRRLTGRTVPSSALSGFDELRTDVARGAINYFDVPFAPKVIVRRRAFDDLVVGGFHVFTCAPGVVDVQVDVAALRLAHVPLLTRQRLDQRATRRPFAAMKKPSYEGWQVDVFIDVADAGELDDFWHRHSLGGTQPLHGSPAVVIDDGRLAAAIAATLDDLMASFGPRLDEIVPTDHAIVPVPVEWITAIETRRVANEMRIDSWSAKFAARRATFNDGFDRWETHLGDLEACLAMPAVVRPRQTRVDAAWSLGRRSARTLANRLLPRHRHRHR
jgi:hypothetical protein